MAKFVKFSFLERVNSSKLNLERIGVKQLSIDRNQL